MNDLPQKIGRTAKIVSSRLKSIYPEHESLAISRLLIEELTQQPYLQTIAQPERQLTDEEKNKLERWMTRLEAGEPVQYILGKAWFYGREFKVSPAVLIPRGETEELTDLIIKEYGRSFPLRALDIGTGAGAIPVILSLTFPQAEIHALEVSAPALEIARKNASTHKARVQFHQMDILKAPKDAFSELDLIVSNPPYVTEEDRSLVPDLVLKHEPHVALFAGGEDPLVFYKRISGLAATWLNPGGKLFFEINESKGPETKAVVEDAGFQEVKLIRDLAGKNRFVSGICTR